MDERRQYFRIQDMAFIEAAPLRAEQTSIPEYFPDFRSLSIKGELEKLEQQSYELYRKLDDDVALRLIGLLNQKLDIITQYLSMQDISETNLEPQQITISEGGVSFVSDSVYEVGQSVAIAIIFTPSYLPVFSSAQVVNCEKLSSDQYQLHCEFIQLAEPMRQKLAGHLLKQQARQRH
jgi:hypothetical protein